ncbi:thiolase-like protein [Mycena sp. CBHHK59/15]|nr:thiolase-like protein [Mycena sp. CBHHK59/15]
MSAKPTLKITGIGVAYPPDLVPVEELDKTAYALYKPSPAFLDSLDKLVAINRRSGIKTRSQVIPWNSPFLSQPTIPSIKAICDIFLKEGLALAVSAARSAIQESGVTLEEITHVVATTCTGSSNPGYDVLLARELGLRSTVEKVLLHGVGCSGGLAGLRLASICATLLHGECCVLSLDCGAPENEASDVGVAHSERGIYEVINSTHMIFPESESILTFNITPTDLTGPSIPILYESLLAALPDSVLSALPSNPADFDWPIHTGGAAFLKSAAKAMGLEKEHMKASWDVYENHGNSSSASVFCVLDVSRRMQEREWAVCVGFGPGLAGEGVLLRRIRPASCHPPFETQ